MKKTSLIFISAILLLTACGRSDSSIITDPTIAEITHQGWPEGGGIYRVIRRNTEMDPCLTIESIKYGGDPPQVLFSKHICKVRVGEKDYNLHDAAAISYEGEKWKGEEFRFRIEYDARVGTPQVQFFDCVVRYAQQDPVPECVVAK